MYADWIAKKKPGGCFFTLKLGKYVATSTNLNISRQNVGFWCGLPPKCGRGLNVKIKGGFARSPNFIHICKSFSYTFSSNFAHFYKLRGAKRGVHAHASKTRTRAH